MQNAATRYHKDIAALDKNTSHHKLAARVPAGTSVLDVGCACGDMGIFLKKTKQCRMTGIEYDEASLAIAAASNAYDCLRQADLNSFVPLEHFPSASFDVLLFGDILEHLYDPQTVLGNFLPLLKEDGRVLISLPNITHASIITQLFLDKFEYMDFGILDRTHIRFFTAENIAQLLSNNGLEVCCCDHVICDFTDLQDKKHFDKLSFLITKSIKSLDHSFVFQYIIESQKSKNNSISESIIREKLLTFSQETYELIKNNKDNYSFPKIFWNKLKTYYQRKFKGK